MEIKIPIEFEKYSNEIESISNQIIVFNDFSCGFIGRSQHKGNFKELYVIYNGYMNEIKVDINFFDDNKYIYKMYPNEFILKPKTAQVFMIYSANEESLEINSELLDYKLKSDIESKLSKLLKQYNLNDYFMKKEVDLVHNNHTDISKTIHIDYEQINKTISETRALNMTDEVYQKINNHSLTQLAYALVEKEEREGYQYFSVLVENKSQDINYKINLITLSIIHKNNEKVIKYKNRITLRNKTSKIVHFKINKNHFEDIDLDNVKYKILIK